MLRYTLLCLLFIFCLSNTFAQELRNRGETRAEAGQSSQADEQRQQFVLSRVDGLAEKMLALRDVRAKTIGSARLADLLWQHDQPFARQLFEKALSFTDDKDKAEPQDTKLLFSLRRNLIVLIAKRDREWAKHLIANAMADESASQSPNGRSEINIEVASSLVNDDPEAAAEFAARSVQRSITPALIFFLKKLRQTNEATANQLFFQALNRVTLLPTVDVNEFALLGTYLFTSPKISNGDSTSMIMTRVGDIGIVDITADQPGISPSLVHAYLEAASQILNRPVSDPQQQQASYVLGKLLLPKAIKYAPDLISSIGASMSALATNVPPNLMQDAAYVNINRVMLDSPEEKMSKAEKIAGAESRDMAYLDIAYNAWLKRDFKSARAAVAKITDHDANSKLTMLINFGEGRQLLLSDQPESIASAENLASELPQGIERALLYLGIAQVAAKAGNAAHAREAVGLSVKATQAITDARRPFLTLATAAQLAPIDSVAAEALLTDAVKGFNGLDETAVANVEWRQEVEVGALVERFPLEVKGVEVGFGPAFRRTIENNLDEGLSQAESLKNEQLRARAFIELAAASLETLPRTTQTKETVVRVGEDGMRHSASKIVMPVYPEEDLRKHQQGVVVIEAQYNGKGVVTDATLVEAPTPSLGQAAISAVNQWKFTPSTLKGEMISVRGKLTFYFVIDENQKGRVENPKRFQ